MASRESVLTVSLVDGVSARARSVERALADAEKQIKGVAEAMADTGASDRLVGQLARLGASAADGRRRVRTPLAQETTQ
jgi:hypothetical protein